MNTGPMNIYQKLLSIRKGFSDAKITKSGTSTYAGFSYFKLDDIVPTITKLCAETQALPIITYGDGVAKMRLINAEKPDEFIEIECAMRDLSGAKNTMNATQAYGAVQTYTRRYLYLTMFDIIEDDELDAGQKKDQGSKTSEQQNESQHPPKRPAMPPQQAPQPQEKPKAQRKPKPGKMSMENKAAMNRLVKKYATVSGTPIKAVVPMIEEYIGIKVSEMTDEQAYEAFATLEKLTAEFSAEPGPQEAPQSA